MRLSISEIKTADCAYLYPDGHMVIVHKKPDRDAGEVKWVTIWENIGIDIYVYGEGRLIIDPEALPFIRHADRITVKPASVDSGSENTKKLGIRVETISIQNLARNDSWHISNFPDLISSDIYWNAVSETFADVKNRHYWNDYKIKKIHYNK